MSDHEDLHFENVREALRSYERFLISSIVASFFLLGYAIERPGPKVSIGFGEISIGLAYFTAMILYFFFSLAARHALVRAAENAARIVASGRRSALRLLPSITTDHHFSFRGIMLVIAPLFMLTSMTIQFFESRDSLWERPWGSWIVFMFIVALPTYAVWEKLRLFDREIARDVGVEKAV